MKCENCGHELIEFETDEGIAHECVNTVTCLKQADVVIESFEEMVTQDLFPEHEQMEVNKLWGRGRE